MDTHYNSIDYYKTDKYKGFYKCQKSRNIFSRVVQLAFTNGMEKIFATGISPEVATARAFIAIDNYHQQQKEVNSAPKPEKQVISPIKVIRRIRKPKRMLVGAN